MDEELALNQFLGAKKAELVLLYIANKIGWKFIPENFQHYVGVRRLDCPEDQCNPVQEFRIWYRPERREFCYNFGSYTNGFSNEPIIANKYKISDILKRMIKFDEYAKKKELYLRKQAISVAAQLFEV